MRLELGEICMTKNINNMCENNMIFESEIEIIITRHEYGDWNDCSEDDIERIKETAAKGQRICA